MVNATTAIIVIMNALSTITLSEYVTIEKSKKHV